MNPHVRWLVDSGLSVSWSAVWLVRRRVVGLSLIIS